MGCPVRLAKGWSATCGLLWDGVGCPLVVGVECSSLAGWNAPCSRDGMPLVGGVECPSSVGVGCPSSLVGGVECPSSVGVVCPLWLEHSWGDASLGSVPLGMETACSGGCLLLKGG